MGQYRESLLFILPGFIKINTGFSLFFILNVIFAYFLFEEDLRKTYKKPKKVFFKDIIGVKEYLEDMEEIKDIIINKPKYEKMGAELPKGILLVGEPGVGKTLIARALANECNAHFEYVSTSLL